MKRYIKTNKNQGVLFGNYIDEYLQPTDTVYLFDDLIGKIDFRCIKKKYCSQGGKVYDPSQIFSVIAYAYFQGITSSRKTSRLICQYLPLLHLAGGNRVCHKTISNFKLNHSDVLPSLLTQTIELSLDSGLVKYSEVFALDGCKFEADASISSTRSKASWELRREKIESEIKSYLESCKEIDAHEDILYGKDNEIRDDHFKAVSEKLKELPVSRIKTKRQGENKGEQAGSKISPKENQKKAEPGKVKVKSLDDADKYLTECSKIDELLEINQDEKPDKLLNLTDPDCRIMKNDSVSKESYNVQIITNNQVIVASDVTQDENDQHQLKPMLDQLHNNLEQTAQTKEEKEEESNEPDKKELKKLNENETIKMTADAGYNSGENLEYLYRDEKIDPYVSMYRRDEASLTEDEKKFSKDNFEYDESSDEWICPTGNRLENYGEKANGNRKETIYTCQLEACQTCPHSSKCIQTKEDQRKGYRTIKDDGYLIYRKEMKEKMSCIEAKKIYKKRSSEVEPVFGQIKWNRKITRFSLRSLEKIKTEMLWIAISHNLGKIFKHLNQSVEIRANSSPKHA